MNAVLPDKVTLYMKQEVSTKRGPAEREGEKIAGTKSRSSRNERNSCFLFRSTPHIGFKLIV